MNNKEFVSIPEFCLDVHLLNVRGIGGGSIILYPNSFIDKVNSFIGGKISKDDLLVYMENNMETFSGNSFKDIEGLVFEDNGKKYQLIINDVLDVREYERDAYERVIKDFIDFWYSNIDVVKDVLMKYREDYTHLMCELFLAYIKHTKIFINNTFSDKDLIPPGNGYIGDLNYKLINNPNVETICKVNSIYKNVFRILFKGLKQTKKNHTHLIILKDDDIEKWNNMVYSIWNKKGIDY